MGCRHKLRRVNIPLSGLDLRLGGLGRPAYHVALSLHTRLPHGLTGICHTPGGCAFSAPFPSPSPTTCELFTLTRYEPFLRTLSRTFYAPSVCVLPDSFPRAIFHTLSPELSFRSFPSLSPSQLPHPFYALFRPHFPNPCCAHSRSPPFLRPLLRHLSSTAIPAAGHPCSESPVSAPLYRRPATFSERAPVRVSSRSYAVSLSPYSLYLSLRPARGCPRNSILCSRPAYRTPPIRGYPGSIFH